LLELFITLAFYKAYLSTATPPPTKPMRFSFTPILYCLVTGCNGCL